MDESRLEVLSRGECLRLLGGAGMGRVAVSVGALPAVFPVAFELLGDDVVFPVRAGTQLEAAVRQTVVAFEADSFDARRRGGWSVLVVGRTSELVPDGRPAFSPAVWPRSPADRLIRLAAERITGRRIALRVGGTGAGEGTAARRAGAGVAMVSGDSSPISFEECLRLLRGERVGRLVLTGRDEPRVFPVNYAMDGDAVVFRTGTGTKLASLSDSLAAFEVDHLDAGSGEGWSVVARGIAQEVVGADPPALRERLDRLEVDPWVPEGRHHVVRVVPFSVHGQRWTTRPRVAAGHRVDDLSSR